MKVILTKRLSLSGDSTVVDSHGKEEEKVLKGKGKRGTRGYRSGRFRPRGKGGGKRTRPKGHGTWDDQDSETFKGGETKGKSKENQQENRKVIIQKVERTKVAKVHRARQTQRQIKIKRRPLRHKQNRLFHNKLKTGMMLTGGMIRGRQIPGRQIHGILIRGMEHQVLSIDSHMTLPYLSDTPQYCFNSDLSEVAKSVVTDGDVYFASWDSKSEYSLLGELIKLSMNPTFVILDLGCTRAMGSHKAIRALLDALRPYGVTEEWRRCNAKMYFANSDYTELKWCVDIIFPTKPELKTTIDVHEEGSVPIFGVLAADATPSMYASIGT